VKRRRSAAALCALGLLVAAPSASPAAPPAPALTVRAAALIEASTGQPLYRFHAGQEVAIASTTKLMTALVTLEHARLGQTFAQPDYHPAPTYSQIGLVPGERMSVRDLVLALLLPSADDAAENLAYNVGHGSVRRFIAMMNARAQELGLAHTSYSTPIGLDTPGNYSTASDLVTLARYVLRTHPFFSRVVRMPKAVLRTGRYPRLIANRNTLVGRVRWVDGVKTGHTLDAGYVLVGSGTRDGMRLISVVLGTTSESARDANTLALLNYGFANFRLRTPVAAGTVLARPAVRYHDGAHADLIAARSITRVFGRSAHIVTRVQAPRRLSGPLRRHAVLGRLTVLADGRPVATVPLLLAKALPAVGPLTIATDFVTRPVTLLLIVLVLAAVLGLAVLRRERIRGRRAAA
jgi:D-alanyl-D-alanine carboxypeptidase (penicillin-binding protein 5/6)